ncbi:glutamine--fructose-6-phosphate transaminase (isomerizing) [Dongia soli]|uniref:Glutamine--fructose-6-phosphate aminotransferase [isomerizing] n=1 Tax=Dongia soli TaxID=600628 RepID=A0ABU5EHZ5_9PROT|nr:glutamine--fructose-6-phosphate transaminase (isomerizing) [Dongia soli]MDY0885649.1 glutamine--fructose-6-phosphate transaminase (isomerizing) [Dongia soli]
MCGIIGILGRPDVSGLLFDGLKRLEYRGYDSAGIATLVDGRIERRRAKGKLANLEKLLAAHPLTGTTGIGHTRWATHGRPSEVNAHPHATGKVALVHNGIIENFQELREELAAAGHSFVTETDTETIAHLLTQYLDEGKTPEEAVAAGMGRLEGAFALAILFAGWPDLIIGARRGSPLAIGYGTGAMYLGSDAIALAPLSNRITYLQEDDWAVLTPEGARFFNHDRRVSRKVQQTALSGAVIGKGNYRHFMMKEIAEQPAVIGKTLQVFLDPNKRRIKLPAMPLDFAKLDRLTITACGTAYLAGFVAKYWFEQIARLPVEIDVASEFRYRNTPLPANGATLVISQSGETADTLAALRYAKAQGNEIVAILNVLESSIGREADIVLPILAGPEIGVASTKAFTAQLTVLAALVLAAAKARQVIDLRHEVELYNALVSLPGKVAEVLDNDDHLQKVAAEISKARTVLFLGRGSAYPLALEGALKLKEITYIHAEGYAAGEMKHGPIALIDGNVPVVILAPHDNLFEKTTSNLQEVHARGGRIILISDAEGIARAGHGATHALELPQVDPFVAPILYAVPLQLLAYYAAVAKGTDIDQPRNLAKSVTVE